VSPGLGQFATVFEDITERKRNEAHLLHHREMLARTEGLAHIGSWEWEMATDTVVWSEELFRILGRDPAKGAVSYAEHPSIYPPDSMARLDRAVREALSEGRPYELELEASRPDGDRRTCLARGLPKLDDQGKVSHLFGSLQDITDRKHSEASLRESEERFRLAMMATSDGLWDWDVRTNQVYYSPAYTQMLGYEPEAFAAIAESWSELILPEDRARVLAANQACIQGATPSFEVEYRMRARDGSIKWILGRGKAISRDSDGVALRLVGTHVDTTERRRAEEELRSSEARYRSLFNNAQVGMFRTRLDGSEILELNDRYLQIIGRTREEVLHSPSSALWAHPEVRAEMVRRLLAAGHVTDFEMSIRHSSGKAVPCLTSIRLFREEGLLEGSLQDISERKQAEAERARFQAQLLQTQKMESLGTLSGGIAHDMNNVLGAILGLASANVELQPPGSPTGFAFETIAKAATRGGEMVRSLLAFARQSPTEERVLDVNALIREEIHLLERTTLAKVQLKLDLDPALHPIRGDGGALTHALMNLSINAVDAMSGIGVLTLRSRNLDQDWIEVAVEDTGCGMPPEVLARAMEPFFTTKQVGKGTGLGLSMVYSTVKAHGGDLEIASTPGQGTSVKLRLPACEPGAEPSPHGDGPAPSAPETRRLTVLLVDDDELIQNSVEAMLLGLGHGVITSPSGEHALAAIQAGAEPHVVILDMNMPGLGGAGTLPRLRDLRPDLPVLLATGRTDQTALDLAKSHPRITLLPKPFTLADLKRGLELSEPEA
jgi:two-component system, cell cycle sensor histidine kinase and response regulator CckA